MNSFTINVGNNKVLGVQLKAILLERFNLHSGVVEYTPGKFEVWVTSNTKIENRIIDKFLDYCKECYNITINDQRTSF